MKGSGKTRILRLISNLTLGGKLLISLSEAVLFRSASRSCFCIDEFEGVGRFNEGTLRELLNAAYKKGIYVERTKKVKNNKGEGYEIEKHELYAPIAMANIWGMENVLSDRCLTLTLEKSGDDSITRLVEDFEDNETIKEIKDVVSAISAFSLTKKNNIHNLWNRYIKERYNTNNINTTNHTEDINDTYNDLFDKIANTSLNSRNLELFFPLFLVAHYCGKDVLKDIIRISEIIIKEKKEEDIEESRDIALIEFISLRDGNEFESLTKLLREFKNFYINDDEESKWMNNKWLGRALKRLVLVKESRRLGTGREVILNVEKAKKLIKMFKDQP